jgi:hypothetical protein
MAIQSSNENGILDYANWDSGQIVKRVYWHFSALLMAIKGVEHS